MKPRTNNATAAFVWMTLSAMSFSVMSFLVRKLSTQVPQFELVFFRSVVNFVIVLSVMGIRRERLLPPKKDLSLLIGRGIAGFLGASCLFYGLSHLPLAIASLLNWSSPLFVIVFSRFLIQERLPNRSLIWIFCSFLGLILLLNPDFSTGHVPLPPFAVFIAVAGAAFGALAYVAVRAATARVGSNSIILYFTGISTLLSAPLAIATGHTPSSHELQLLLVLGIFASLGQFAMTQGYRFAPAGIVSTMGLLNAAFAALLGWQFLGEVFGWSQWVGMLWLALSVMMVTRSSK
ncbi:DMT family transporter [bacterium]|jgi:drug/metabolite transporter (DMT)-like permease|nr:DMT family transporter [bacterium]